MKRIYDPIHRFISLSLVEAQVVELDLFQRLHDIHQLGMAYCVYPGATHKRFEHSLGTMEIASQIYDRVTHPTALCESIRGMIPAFGSEEHSRWRQLLRIAALCHDLGHLPFSHTAETLVVGEKGHEKWTYRALKSSAFSPIWQALQATFEDPENQVLTILDPSASKSAWEAILHAIIAGDLFGSDRIDYLLRDARATGLSYGLFDYHQLIQTLQILPDKKMAIRLGLDEEGMPACESLLLARYFMHKRLYQYPTIQSYHFHLARIIKKFFSNKNLETEFFSISDADILHAIKQWRREGDVDANALFNKKERVHAIALSTVLTKEHLASLKRITKSPYMWHETPNTKTPLLHSLPINIEFPHWLYVEHSDVASVKEYLRYTHEENCSTSSK